MSALDRLQGDVARVLWKHATFSQSGIDGALLSCDGCDWTGNDGDAHVSERVMAMLADKWGLREEGCGPRVFGGPYRKRLVTDPRDDDWRTDDTAREGGEGHG